MKTFLYPPLLAALSSALLPVYAQSPRETLAEITEEDPVIVIANRLPENEDEILSAVDLITSEEISRSQTYRLQDLANRTAGVLSTSTAGQDGQLGTLIIRGLPTRYNQLVLDGVKVSSSISTGTYGNLYGNFNVVGPQRLEILKGGQSVQYGSGAAGGVVGSYTELGTGDPEFDLTTEAGSFQSYLSHLGMKGAVDKFSYGISLSDQFTANDLRGEAVLDARNSQFSTALQYELTGELAAKLVLRGGISRLDSNGSIYKNSHQLISPQLHYRSEVFRSSAVLGLFQEDYDLPTYFTNLDKRTFTLDNELLLSENLSLKGGLDFEWNTHQAISTYPGYESNQKIEWQSYAAFLGGQFKLGGVTLEAGGRLENQTIYDALPSFHLAASYHLPQSETTFYTRFSSAYVAPSLLQTGAYPTASPPQIANDDLEVERLKGIELGIKQRLGAHQIALTAYFQSIQDAASPVTLPSGERQYQNRAGSSEIIGVEGSLEGTFFEALHYSLVFNHSARNERLDVPENNLQADLFYESEQFTLGLGYQYVSNASFGSNRRTDDRNLVRLYGAYRPSENLELTARIENLFDEQYELYDSGSRTQYGRGFGAFGGIKLSF